MEYKGKNLKTMGEVFDTAIKLAKTAKTAEEEAQNFFKLYAKHIFENNDSIPTLKEAEEIARGNFGYFAGYYDSKVCDLIYNTYHCSHPLFGDKPFEVTPEDAYNKGLEIGNKLK